MTTTICSKTLVVRLWLGTLVLVLVTWVAACERPAPANQDPLQVGTETLEFTLNQRMTQTVPGVMGRISLKLGDVETAKGVEDIEVIDHKDESSVASAKVLRKGGVLDFKIDGTPYVIQLMEYDAAHIVSDTATFTLRLDR